MSIETKMIPMSFVSTIFHGIWSQQEKKIIIFCHRFLYILPNFIHFCFCFSLFFSFFLIDRQSKINSENHQSSEDVNVAKRSTKVSSICILPDNGINTTSHPSSIISSTDEGGFNEPSPEIKAKLKPAYPFDTIELDAKDQNQNERDDAYEANQHTLHYVDFGYRLNPDGSESKQCFSEDSETYATDRNNGFKGLVDSVHGTEIRGSSGYTMSDTVYASIKNDSKPVAYSSANSDHKVVNNNTNNTNNNINNINITNNVKNNCDNAKKHWFDDIRKDLNGDDDNDIDAKFEQIYNSQETDGYSQHHEKNGSLDSQNNTDASDKEDLPDAMTAYEADRLLSSRYVSFH